MMSNCKVCRTPLTEKNWQPARRAAKSYICRPCFNTYKEEWFRRKEHLPKLHIKWNARNRARIADLRHEVLLKIGRICVCCSESNPVFLTVDHIQNDGRRHRAAFSGNTVALYNSILKATDARERFRTLCYNCNCGRHRNGGICPHVQSRTVVVT